MKEIEFDHPAKGQIKNSVSESISRDQPVCPGKGVLSKGTVVFRLDRFCFRPNETESLYSYSHSQSLVVICLGDCRHLHFTALFSHFYDKV